MKYHDYRGHTGGFNTVPRAAMALWRAMQDYHRLIVEDDMRNVKAGRQTLKRARRRLFRALQWGVNYDQPLPRLRLPNHEPNGQVQTTPEADGGNTIAGTGDNATGTAGGQP